MARPAPRFPIARLTFTRDPAGRPVLTGDIGGLRVVIVEDADHDPTPGVARDFIMWGEPGAMPVLPKVRTPRLKKPKPKAISDEKAAAPARAAPINKMSKLSDAARLEQAAFGVLLRHGTIPAQGDPMPNLVPSSEPLRAADSLSG